jgi:WXG100 family type VII secretion target
MKIRINHNEMTNVKEQLFNEAEVLMSEIETIEKNIQELKNVWQGEDANIFYIKINNYLTKMKSIPKTYESMSRFLERANIRYKEADRALKNEIDRVRVNG